jgi:ribosomal protein S15P/S13E
MQISTKKINLNSHLPSWPKDVPKKKNLDLEEFKLRKRLKNKKKPSPLDSDTDMPAVGWTMSFVINQEIIITIYIQRNM